MRMRLTLTAGLLLCAAVPALVPGIPALAHSPLAAVIDSRIRLGIVIDHDPMRMTIGSPPPMVMRSPPPRGHAGPPAKVPVTPDPSLNQILVERPTPISVATGNTTQTKERLRLECYVSSGRSHGLLLLHRLTEGDRGDYSLSAYSSPIVQGRASFTIRFHRAVLGPHALGSRTVYLVTFKDTTASHGQGDDCIQTVTVLSDDPAALRGNENNSGDKK